MFYLGMALCALGVGFTFWLPASPWALPFYLTGWAILFCDAGLNYDESNLMK